MSKPSRLRRVLSAIWNGITRVRLALSNILFLVFLAVIYFVYVGGTPEPLPTRAALLLNPMGSIVDQKSQADPLQAFLGEPSPADHEVPLKDVIEAIDYARDDPAINSIVMELGYLAYVGISKTHEIVRALTDFSATGKRVIAVGDYFTQDQYLLASYADEILVHPLGGVALEGFSSYQNYFQDALEKLSVDVHVFRAGEFKSAMEPFTRNDMSQQHKEATARWLDDLWQQYTGIVEAQRELQPGAVDAYVNNFAERLKEQGGDASLAALDAGLVDKRLNRHQANDYLKELVGASNEDGLYEAIPFERYVARKRPLSLAPASGERVAVITAQGDIIPGEQPPGSIGGDSLARLIRTTAEQDGVKAIVLRINSGGGSMFASEVIREAVLQAKTEGLPVVASMGAIAASGGYYIAADADEIWATPATITGSIGVFAAFPTFDQLLQRLGVYTDGVGTTSLAGSLRADRALNPQLVEAIESGVDHAYATFLDIVAQGRGMTDEAVDLVARGRVWSAADAQHAGLVDKIGTLEEAIVAAAQRAGLTDYDVDYVGLPRTPREILLQQLSERVGAYLPAHGTGVGTTLATVSTLFGPVRAAAAELNALQDPRHLYLRCVACAVSR
tara:strand:- start:236735 stop:238591 length:1857 start_codon:yes stop_codon:yes gene_type:complete